MLLRRPIIWFATILSVGCVSAPSRAPSGANPSQTLAECDRTLGSRDNVTSPLVAHDGTATAEEIVEDDDSRNYRDEIAPNRKTGVRITLNPLLVGNRRSLEYRIECAQARYQVDGAAAPGFDVDPLAVRGTRWRVGEERGRFAVEVRGDRDTLQELERRSRLVTRAAAAPTGATSEPVAGSQKESG